MIKSLITDPKTGRQAEVIDGQDEPHSLSVATRPYKTFENADRFFTNPIYGIDINKNASAGGTTDNIHNGNDNIYWTASTINGIYDFSSTDQNHTPAGAQSIDCTGSINGDIFQVDKGSEIAVGTYTSFAGWLYISSYWGPNDNCNIILYNTISNTQVSENVINLSNYVNTGMTGSWQSFSVPMVDFGIQTAFDAMRFTTIAQGSVPDYYLDDLVLQETGIITYTIEPSLEKWLYVYGFNLQIADEYAGTLINGTMPNIPYNSFFALPQLSTGFVYSRIQGNKTVVSNNIRKFIDIMLFPGAQITGHGSDGTNSWVSIKLLFTEPVILKAEKEDKMTITISEDWSPLLLFRISAGCKEESRHIIQKYSLIG